MIEGTELVTAVLDDLLRSDLLKSWSKAMRVIPGDDATRTIDVYAITFGPQADADDRERLEAFLQRHGQTGNTRWRSGFWGGMAHREPCTPDKRSDC